MKTIFHEQKVAVAGKLDFTPEDMQYALRALTAQYQPKPTEDTGILIIGRTPLSQSYFQVNYPNAILVFDYELDELLDAIDEVDDWSGLVERAREHYQSLH